MAVVARRQVHIDGRNLFDPNSRLQLATYISQILSRRAFIVQDAKVKAFKEQRDYILGRVWLVLQPVIRAAMYGILFGVLLQTSRNIENFIGYLFIGIAFFGFITGQLNGGAGLVKSQRSLFVSFNFPRACIVLSRSLRMSIDAAVPALMAILVALIAQYNEPIKLTILYVPLVILLMALFGCGLMFIVARITAFLPDARVIVTIGSQAWFYSSCIFYSISRFDHAPTIRQIVEYNPGYKFIETVRNCVMYGIPPNLTTWMILIGWSVFVFVLGFVFFWQAEERYVEVR